MSLEVTFCHILTHYCRFSRAYSGFLLMEEDLPGPRISCPSVSLMFCARMPTPQTTPQHPSSLSEQYPLPISLQWFNRLFKTIFSLKRVFCSLRKNFDKDTQSRLWTYEVPMRFGPCCVFSSITLLQAHRLWHVLQTTETIPTSKS